MHRSLLKRSPLLAFVCQSFQCLISALTQAGGGGLLFRLLVPSRWRCFPHLRCSGSRLFYMECALHCTRFQPSGVPQKHGARSCACVLCLPRLSSSGSQELDRHTLPGVACLLPSVVPVSVSALTSPVHAPSALRVPSPSPRPHQLGACALCLATTLPVDVNHPESQEVFD